MYMTLMYCFKYSYFNNNALFSILKKNQCLSKAAERSSDKGEEELSVVKEASWENLMWDVIRMCFITMCLLQMISLEKPEPMRYRFLTFSFKIIVKLSNSRKDCHRVLYKCLFILRRDRKGVVIYHQIPLLELRVIITNDCRQSPMYTFW